MKTNVGTIDKVIRLLVAVLLIVLFFTNVVSTPFSYVFLVLGIVFILTSLIGFCPLYLPFGLNTNKKK